jgi:hypothetical protein
LFNLPVEIEFVDDVYIAKCNIIQGAFASWDTPEEALKELIDVIKMIQDFKKNSTPLELYKTKANKYITTLPIILND